MTAPLRIAMWSGPRNISTAMMRAWENRGDCAVSDEPLYAHYLAHTGLDHPMREEIVAHGETGWRKVAAALTGDVPLGKPVWYQKHMSHHLLPHIDHDWVHGLANAFLIRDPAQVVQSYMKARATVCADDIGLLQEVRLFDELAERSGRAPPVIDADEFLRAPAPQLRALCTHFGIDYSERMLQWPSGPRDSDGVWAPHWYAAVCNSTGFEAPREKKATSFDGEAARVADECRPLYEYLYRFRLTSV